MKEPEFTKSVLEQIEHDHIKMKPRSYFLIRSLALKTLYVLIFVVLFLLVNVLFLKLTLHLPLRLLAAALRGLRTVRSAYLWVFPLSLSAALTIQIVS